MKKWWSVPFKEKSSELHLGPLLLQALSEWSRWKHYTPLS